MELHMLDGWEKIVPMQWLNSKPKRSHGNCFQVSQDHVSLWKGRYWSKCYMHTQRSTSHLEFLQIDVAWAIIYLSKSTMSIPFFMPVQRFFQTQIPRNLQPILDILPLRFAARSVPMSSSTKTRFVAGALSMLMVLAVPNWESCTSW